jgi:GT2 family glycosyltransferase
MLMGNGREVAVGMVKGDDLQSCLNDMLAVLVVYRRDLAISDTFVSLSRSLEKLGCHLELIVYDNSPSPQDVSLAKDGPCRLTYHHDPSNPGVSKAYNTALRMARERGKRWLLLLDQDTSFPPDALPIYFQALQSGQAELFAPVLKTGARLISPCFYWKGIGFPLMKAPKALMPLKNRSVLNSGMLVNVVAMDRIGGFNEQIPLDFADHDFCSRFSRASGSVCILDMDCQHRFADREVPDFQKDLHRFSLYCTGARRCISSPLDAIGYAVTVFVRCGVLTLRYRSMRFLGILFRDFAAGEKTE